MSALIAQAELGNFVDDVDNSTDRDEKYLVVLPQSDTCRTAEFLTVVRERHAMYRGCERESAQYKLLQEAMELEAYGMLYYDACDAGTGHQLHVGVGPEGIVIHDDNWTVISRFEL